MSTIKKRSISIICMLALILSVFSIMPASQAYAGISYTEIEADGTCYSGDVSSSGTANYSFTISSYSLVQVTVTDANYKLYYDCTQ